MPGMLVLMREVARAYWMYIKEDCHGCSGLRVPDSEQVTYEEPHCLAEQPEMQSHARLDNASGTQACSVRWQWPVGFLASLVSLARRIPDHPG